MSSLWGIDLGGTKIEGVILSSRKNPEIILRPRIATEQEFGYDHILAQIQSLIHIMEEESGLNAPSYIGLATPGVLDPSLGTIKNSNTTCLNGKHLKRDLEEKLGLEFTLANDANCFALAETKMGAVRKRVPTARVVIGTIMGTGVGSGIVVDGKVLYGKHGISGEWGHLYLDDSGGECYCGRVGCVETIISGSALQKYFFTISGEKLTFQEIIELVRNGSNEHAIRTFNRLIQFFGKGIAQLINIIDPDAIILGGGLGNIDELYTLGVEEAKKHLFNHTLETPFLKPELGDSAGVIGAALL